MQRIQFSRDVLSSSYVGKNGWFWPTEGNISGCDFAGVVEELGEGVTDDLHVGERVACWVHGCAYLYVVSNSWVSPEYPLS